MSEPTPGDCRSETGIIVGLVDGMIAASRVVARYLRENGAQAEEIREALADIAADEDIALVVGSACH
jgi:hypothetical protein